MRAFLIFFTGLLLTTIPAFSQISDFPYNQGFEDPFIAFGSNVEFKDDWTGNHVNNNNTRIFRSEKFIRSGRYALAVQPISSFDGVFTIELDLSGYDLIRLHFYARSAKNGSGSRPVLARISTSVDGGANFIKRENIGNETTFPNQDTDFALYIYDLPPSAASQQKVLIKFEIMYASAFGEGTAALFLLDDLSIYEKEEDVKIIEVSPLNANTLQLIFNQEVDETSAETLENYTIEPFNSIISAKRNPLSKNSISLQFENTFYKGNNKLSVKNIYNIDNSNHLEEQAFSFSYIPPPSIPGFNELLITEIMADPDPSAGLPVSEFFELYNPTSKTLTLKNIEFSDATSSTKFPDMVIESEKYLVAVPNNKIELFEGIAPVIGLSPWPSLNVGGDQLSLTSSEGKLIFSVNYNKSWYKNPIKSEGGWSLEMIYTKNPCGGIENWAASINNLGGTPGYENSIAANQPDVSLPRLSSAIALSEDKILLKFDKKIQPDINDLSSFSILPQLEIQSAEIQVPELNAILLTLSDSLNHHSIYEIFVNNLNDCAGNPIDINFNSAVFALPDLADSLDIIINEVLFNPRTGGVKFIEIYNKSEKFINLKNWHLGNELDIQNSSIKLLSNEDFIIEPKSFLAISQDSEKLKSEYPKGKEDRFLQIQSLPSYPISEGSIVLHNDKGIIIDFFSYSDAYHSSILRNTKGVSLERISAEGITNHPSNWQSAASTVGFATPGYKNSQFRLSLFNDMKFIVDPKIFIPDNTGFADFTSINYKLGSGGFYGTLHILDTNGNLVKKLAKNEQLPSEGFFTWDGTDDNNRRVRIGYYLIYFEIYNLSGNIEILKETVVVGKRF